MYRWIVGRIARRLIAQTVAGNPTWTLRMADEGVHFVFPGDSSFAADTRDKPSLASWLDRFASLRPDYELEDVLVAGPPWNTRVAMRFHDRIGADYENDGMHYLKMRWGKLVYDRVFLDTQTVAAWETRHPELTRPTPASNT